MDFKKLRSIRVPSSLLMRRTQERAKPVAETSESSRKPDGAQARAATDVGTGASGRLQPGTVKPRTPKTPLGASKPSAQPRPEPPIPIVAEPVPEPVVVVAAAAASKAQTVVQQTPHIAPSAPELPPAVTAEPVEPEIVPQVVAAAPQKKPQTTTKTLPKPVIEALPSAIVVAAPTTAVVPAAPPVRAHPHRARRFLHLPHPHWRNFWLFVWIVLAIGAAQTALYVRPLVGVYVDAAAFSSLLWLALRIERARQLVISVAIIPLLMLVSLCLPQATVFIRTADLSLLMLVLALVYRYLFTLDYSVDGTRLRMTRHGYLFALPLMVVFGQLLGLVGFGLLRHQYDFRDSTLPLVALGSVVFAIAEESLFRGLIQQRAMLLFNPKLATALSAALYAGLMFGHRGGLLSPVFGALLGTSLAIVYYKKQNLLLTITINAATKLTYIGLVAIFVLRH